VYSIGNISPLIAYSRKHFVAIYAGNNFYLPSLFSSQSQTIFTAKGYIRENMNYIERMRANNFGFNGPAAVGFRNHWNNLDRRLINRYPRWANGPMSGLRHMYSDYHDRRDPRRGGYYNRRVVNGWMDRVDPRFDEYRRPLRAYRG
jgi:hypothetical protein